VRISGGFWTEFGHCERNWEEPIAWSVVWSFECWEDLIARHSEEERWDACAMTERLGAPMQEVLCFGALFQNSAPAVFRESFFSRSTFHELFFALWRPFVGKSFLLSSRSIAPWGN